MNIVFIIEIKNFRGDVRDILARTIRPAQTRIRYANETRANEKGLWEVQPAALQDTLKLTKSEVLLCFIIKLKNLSGDVTDVLAKPKHWCRRGCAMRTRLALTTRSSGRCS